MSGEDQVLSACSLPSVVLGAPWYHGLFTSLPGQAHKPRSTDGEVRLRGVTSQVFAGSGSEPRVDHECGTPGGEGAENVRMICAGKKWTEVLN